MEPKVSTKSTKTEILDAYEALLKEVGRDKSDKPKLIQEEKQKKEMIEKVSETDIRLKDQMIASLQEKIKDQQAQLKEFTGKANRAEANVKDIAVKAIKNSSKVQMYAGKTERDEV